jgi:two-component system, chemotaxis family, chemotaxis protein CheY
MTDTGPVANSEGTKILIVDDSMAMRMSMNDVLSRNGFTVLEATDGENALEILATERDVALVLTDLNMPRLDGIGLLRSIRSERRYLALPVIMQTTEAQSSVITMARQAGATGWLIKPYGEEDLLRAVHRLLGGRPPAKRESPVEQ